MGPDETQQNDDNFLSEVTGGEETAPKGKEEEEESPTTTQPDELKAALAELTKNVQGLAKPKDEPKKTFTQDEINEYWGVYNPEKTNPDFFKKWMRLPPDLDPQEAAAFIAERKALFAEMQTGLSKQAVRAAQILMQQEIEKIRAEIAPLQENVTKASAEKLRTDFFTAYPTLSEPKLAPILKAVSIDLNDQVFTDAPAYFKALAEGVGKMITAATGQPFDIAAVKPTSKSTVTTPRLPRTTAGGTGGSGGGRVLATAGKGTSDDDSASLEWMK